MDSCILLPVLCLYEKKNLPNQMSNSENGRKKVEKNGIDKNRSSSLGSIERYKSRSKSFTKRENGNDRSLISENIVLVLQKPDKKEKKKRKERREKSKGTN